MIKWWTSLFPVTRVCWFCHASHQSHVFSPISKQICFACLQQLSWIESTICHVCGRMYHQSQQKKQICVECDQIPSTQWVYNRSVFQYSTFIKKLIWQYKYRGQIRLAKPLGKLMAKKLVQYWGKQNFCISFVPLHSDRLKERGFNQAEYLAKEIGQYLHLPVYNLLVRDQSIPPQIGKSRLERLISLQDAFRLNDHVKDMYWDGKQIVLIDDVYTTGTTLRQCAKPFRKLGLDLIYSLTIAR